ncbi:MAG TPA: ABC transporter permease [Flavipsychrobacter sp.]|nr:ABC transporter permease [Flavipsychrobacter sp.]
MTQYSNAKAMRALIKASLQAILRSPSAIVFSIAFPLVFILVFGFLGNGEGGFSVRVASAPGSDTSNRLYAIMHNVPVLKWTTKTDTAAINKDLTEGNIAAIINIKKQPEGVQPQYVLTLNTVSSQEGKVQQLQSVLKNILENQDPEIQKHIDALAKIDVNVAQVREYKTIDFILPGQLGFSLLAAGVFGTAFVFFNLRQTLVLKRFFATPVRREIIVLSEGIARMLFQLTGAIIIIGLGYFAFGFTLINGWITFLEMLALCAISLMVFMGFGFIISGIAKSEATIPPLSNLITLPQFLLAGTFFPIDYFPKWLQYFCDILPLSYLNDGLRKIAFDGANLWAVKMDILALLIWGVVIYFAAGKAFRWE